MSMLRRRSRPVYRHPVNAELFNEQPLGARVADAATEFIGSWKFIAIQKSIVKRLDAGGASPPPPPAP